jgi:hypothetical protein
MKHRHFVQIIYVLPNVDHQIPFFLDAHFLFRDGFDLHDID